MVKAKKFQRRKEDFRCTNCGLCVLGTGYTNHCPRCLWSRHVDIHPGDRAAECGGMMAPVKLTIRAGRYIITHRCLKCGHTKNNRTSDQDDIDALIKLSARRA